MIRNIIREFPQAQALIIVIFSHIVKKMHNVIVSVPIPSIEFWKIGSNLSKLDKVLPRSHVDKAT